jgi:hypothetical protein
MGIINRLVKFEIKTNTGIQETCHRQQCQEHALPCHCHSYGCQANAPDVGP